MASPSGSMNVTKEFSLTERGAAAPKPTAQIGQNAKTNPTLYNTIVARLRIVAALKVVALKIVAVLKVVITGLMCIICAAVVFGPILGLVCCLGAGVAVVSMLIGNAVLRAAHLAHYTDNAMAAAIGATGSPIAVLIIGLFYIFIPTGDNGRVHWSFNIFLQTGLSTLSGTLGAAILVKHIDLHGTDVLHATRAGAVGGVILVPATILALQFVLPALGTVISSLWMIMKRILSRLYDHYGKSWDGERHRSNSDSEVETQQLPRWSCVM